MARIVKRDVWSCWACLSWWPRSEPTLRKYTFGDGDEPACPRCGVHGLILLQRGVYK